MIVLVPADVLHPARADAHFAAEAEAARAAGMEVALVDHDALTRPEPTDAAAAVRRVRAAGPAVYRGWMLRTDRYAAFDDALRARGVTLCTTAPQYRRAHEFPGWYDIFRRHTPESRWTHGARRDDFDRARGDLGTGPAVVRDYTKSVKHHWREAMYIPDLAAGETAWTVARRLHDLRGSDFTGGFVVRRFEELAADEVRTWWVDGTCRLVGPHPDSPDRMPDPAPDPRVVEPLVRTLGCRFVTVDFALRADGVWRVLEIGDGQVSDRPATLPAPQLLRALAQLDDPGSGRST
ncbi:ATP-grasp domain-containing protein [Nocardia veterana]|uniref:ATP-grasp domain-containing protein n=1 Tax=Nocardia veterana TaxID=132249 RepID=A0A7X6LV60_9NOCA|nr:ATP-grasp domain-containing protein [Nocardia veterana]NKY85113.1 ATP-grasp domain-containing protein [Nocardia veterana]